MVIGLALFSWDQKIGPVLDVQYPEALELSDSLINKIYMTHSYSQEFYKEELIEINFENKSFLSYCDKRRISDVGHEIIILNLQEKEKINSYNLKRQLFDFARGVFQRSKSERNKFFLEGVKLFFKKSSAKKILLLGRAGTGKSTIKEIIFEGKNPKDLLSNPLAPTRGITPSIYSWLDLDLGLFDSSGQELQYLLSDAKEQNIAFDNTDAIIYLFDFQIWVAKSEEIIDEIRSILKIIENKSLKSKLVLFLHKTDLMSKDSISDKIMEIREIIDDKLGLPIYFTSIYPYLIYSLYNAFYEILSNFSEETTALKTILDKNIVDIPKLMCFITDPYNSIIVQTMSNDFNTDLINQSHVLIAQLNHTFEDMTENQIEHVIISSTNNLNIIMENLNLKKFDIKNLIIISETESVNKLIMLTEKIGTSMNQYLYYNKIY